MASATLFHVPLAIAVRANSMPNGLALPLLENPRPVVLLVPAKAHHVATNGQNLGFIKYGYRVACRSGAAPKLESVTHRAQVARKLMLRAHGFVIGD